MKVVDMKSPISATAIYTVIADSEELSQAKKEALDRLSPDVKIAGFRKGKVPKELIEKHFDQNTLQSETLNRVIDKTYSASIAEKNLIPVGQPKITILKFVPFSDLEYRVELEIIGGLKVADYTKFNLKLKKHPVTDKQLTGTLEELRQRAASFTKVKRQSKEGDRLLLDFDATDPKTKVTLPSASATNYYLTLGSKAFIPGFEEKLIGQEEGIVKPFTLQFPTDYPDPGFKSRKVNFSVTIKDIEEPKLDNLDDKFANKIGPFKSLKELENQLSIELQAENDRLANSELDTAVLNKLAETTKCNIPASLIEAEVKSITNIDQQTALRNGLTWSEFLKTQGLTEAEYASRVKPAAESRIKSGLALIEIAKAQNISVSASELDTEVAKLKIQYKDSAMQAELEKEAVRSDLTKRILTQKVLEHIEKSN